MGKGDLEAIWKEKADPRNKYSQDVPSGLLRVDGKVLAAGDCRGDSLTREKELPYVRHSPFQPAPADSSLPKTERISNASGASVVTYSRKVLYGLFHQCFCKQ